MYKFNFLVYVIKNKMDPVMNSQQQSPLVRSLATVPSKSSSFVHGLRDNVPPFSFSKVVVKPTNKPTPVLSSWKGQEGDFKFKIPQSGVLNRAYLRIRMECPIPNSALTGVNTYKIASTTYKVRIPWVHTNQIGLHPGVVTPFGSGGTNIIFPTDTIAGGEDGSFLSPTTGTNPLSNSGTELLNPLNFMGNSSSAWNAVTCIDSMSLSTTSGGEIDFIPGECIPNEIMKMAPSLRDFYIKGMVGYCAGECTGGETETGGLATSYKYKYLYDPSLAHRNAAGEYLFKQNIDVKTRSSPHYFYNNHADFIVPVCLSSLKTLQKNYDTRFVEDMVLTVTTKAMKHGYEHFVSSDITNLPQYHMELVLLYHNWTSNIEHSIRNTNYKRGIPASVYSSSWIKDVNAEYNPNLNQWKLELTSDQLATELCLVAKDTKFYYKNTTTPRPANPYWISKDGGRQHFLVEFWGDGRKLWEASTLELMGPDSAEYDLTDRRISGGDTSYGGIHENTRTVSFPVERALDVVYVDAADDQQARNGLQPTQGGIELGFGDATFSLRFGMSASEEFYSGGIGLKTIANPTIIIKPFDNATQVALDADPHPGRYTNWDALQFQAYVKYSHLIRIDSDNGSIRRTLDL